jgi:hypothetical protein
VLLQMDLARPAIDYARTPFWVAAGLLVVTFALCLRLPARAAALQARGEG